MVDTKQNISKQVKDYLGKFWVYYSNNAKLQDILEMLG